MNDTPMRAVFLWTLVLGGCRGFYDSASSSGASGTTSSPTMSSSSDASSDGSTSGTVTNTDPETTGDTGAPATTTPTGRTGSTADTGSVDPLCGPTDPEPVEGPLPLEMLPRTFAGEEQSHRDHEAGLFFCDADVQALQATLERPIDVPEVDWSQHAVMWALHVQSGAGGPWCQETPRSVAVDGATVVLGVAAQELPDPPDTCNDSLTFEAFVALVPRAAYEGARIEVLPDYPAEE